MKEFKKALNNGNFHKNSNEFPESTIENFTITIYTEELRYFLCLGFRASQIYFIINKQRDAALSSLLFTA